MAKADSALERCDATGGLLGCLFEPPADPACLGAASQSIASDLVEAVFDSEN